MGRPHAYDARSCGVLRLRLIPYTLQICSPHERSDMRELSRISPRHAGYACYSFAPRDAFLAARRADQRARSRFTARSVIGATTCNARDAAPATSPLKRSNARSGPKYHMTPRPLSQGHRRAALGTKRKWKSPVRRRRGPEKIPVRNCQRTRNILGSPAQGGLKNAKLPHRGGRAIEDAHDDTPKTKKSSPQQSCLRRRANVGLIQPNRTGCLYAISQLGERGRPRF
jgi:hypothetical protein